MASPRTQYTKCAPRWVGALFVTVLATIPGRADALSTLFFDGDLHFSVATGRLDVDGTITALSGISSAPVLAGSTLDLHAQFASVASTGGVTTGLFGNVPAATDLEARAGDATLLLAGEILSLAAIGGDGLDLGLLRAEITPTGGSLLPDFTDPVSLFALQLNLTTVFGAKMFDGDFTGHADGRLEAIAGLPPASAVPEPATWTLLALGLLSLTALQLRPRKLAAVRSRENRS